MPTFCGLALHTYQQACAVSRDRAGGRMSLADTGLRVVLCSRGSPGVGHVDVHVWCGVAKHAGTSDPHGQAARGV